MLARGFGWRAEDVARGILGEPSLEVPVTLKQRKSTKDNPKALLALAESLARRAVLAYRGSPGTVPAHAAVLRAEVIAEHGAVTLSELLSWCWEHGILVVPMAATKGFSAGAWLIGDQPVVVIKEAPDYRAYWLFALAHELGHIALGHVAKVGIVDVASPHTSNDTEERQANQYALDLLVPDHAVMLREIRERSEGPRADDIYKFKAEEAAQARGYNKPLTLLVAAFALPGLARDDSRWGSANNEAKREGSGRRLVAEQFAGRVDLNELDRLDSLLVKELALAGVS